MIEPPTNPPECRYLAEVDGSYVVTSYDEVDNIVGMILTDPRYRVDSFFPCDVDWEEVTKDFWRVRLSYPTEFEYDNQGQMEECLLTIKDRLSAVGHQPDLVWRRTA